MSSIPSTIRVTSSSSLDGALELRGLVIKGDFLGVDCSDVFRDSGDLSLDELDEMRLGFCGVEGLASG
eukprot:CAMPEP_0184330540 /NCGR_PEP_ID=MMETSP1049-20130417/144739_1 /TAXON_ID=77928 /ORGANISM="Proteomonas sulcata, Strain CCMP704" /LENGTH=67 /DNA_ID=CAMNT_0026652985 /DNA_START=966 /DNA_END=1169 /DNA_ORIENTATION=+